MDDTEQRTAAGNGSTGASSDGAGSAGGTMAAGSTATLPPPAPDPGIQFLARPTDLVEIGATLFQEAESVLRSSRKQRVRIRLGRKVLAEMPLAAGAVGVMAIAMLAVALSRLTVELE